MSHYYTHKFFCFFFFFFFHKFVQVLGAAFCIYGRAEGGAWVRIELSGVPSSDAACVRRKARADTRPRETRNPGGTGRTSQRTAAPVEFLLSVSIIVETNL